MRLKGVLKGMVCIGCAVVVSLASTISTFADDREENNSKVLSRSMINYFRTKNELDTNSISNDEMRVFGAFISNLYAPYETKLNKVASNKALKKKMINIFFGGTEPKDKSIDVILKKLQEGVTANSKKLYVDADCTIVATLGNLISRKYKQNGKDEYITYLYTTDKASNGGHKIAYKCSSDKGKPAKYYDVGVMVSMLSNVKGATTALDEDKAFSDKAELRITPFGDIVSGNSYMVVVPACLNPRTFYKTSSLHSADNERVRIPVNNAFIMGGIIDTSEDAEPYKVYAGSGSDTETFKTLGFYANQDVIRSRKPFGTKSMKSGIFGNDKLAIGAYRKLMNKPGWDKNSKSVIGLKYEDYVRIYAENTDVEELFDTEGRGTLWDDDFQNDIDNRDIDIDVTATNVIDTIGVYSSSAWSDEKSKLEIKRLFTTSGGNADEGLASINESLWTKKYKNGEFNEIYNSKDDDIFHYDKKEYYNDITEAIHKKLNKKNIAMSADLDTSVQVGGGTERDQLLINGAQDFISLDSNFIRKLRDNLVYVSDSDKVGKKSLKVAQNINLWAGIYWAYFSDILGLQKSGGELTSGSYDNESSSLPELDIGLTYSGFNLADMLSGVDPVETAENEIEKMQEDIIRRTYQLLDTEHTDYRDSWIKGVVNDTILAIHNSIVGSDFTGSIMSVGTGNSNSSYTGVMGYVTTPKLAELPFTSWLISNYFSIYIIIMVVIVILLTMLWVSRQKKWQEALMLFVVISAVLILPKTLIDGTIGVTNTLSEAVYGDRFLFWAIVQNQQGEDEIEETEKKSGEASAAMLSNLQDVENVTSDTGIRLKWMSPKKKSTLDTLLGNKMSNELTTNTSIFRWLFAGVMQQETYVNDPLATYLYRPYNDIAKSASEMQIEISKINGVSEYNDIGEFINNKYKIRSKEKNEVFKRESMSGNGLFMGQIKKDNAYSKGEYKSVRGKSKNYSYITELFNSKTVNDAMFKSVMKEQETNVGFNANSIKPNDKGGNLFLLYSESPYYYFYNVFAQAVATVQDEKGKYQEISALGGSNKGGFEINDFSHILLSKDFFKVTNDNSKKYNKQAGEIRDFLNMEGLFTYVIPYLNYGNEFVQLWTEKYGAEISEIDYSNEQMLGLETKEAKKDRLHNEVLGNVWNMYSPWVDTMYDTGVYNKRIRTAAYDVTIYDSINPDSYAIAKRPMAFGPADMHAKNLEESELTDIEVKIKETLEDTYKDLMYLNNYQGFDDDVLISAAAMIATFNFNKNFSDNNIFSESYTLYPQGFEMKNMNYDAFLRLILMNSTGENLTSKDGSIYKRVLDKSSVITGVLMIAVDAISVYVIPAAKILMLFSLFLLSIIMIIYCLVGEKTGLVKMIAKTLFLPLLLFAINLMGLSLIVSLFVGEGMTGIVGQKTLAIVTNDPAVTLLLLLLVDIVFLIVMWNIFKGVFKSLKTYIPGTFLAIAGTAAATTAVITSKLAKAPVDGGKSLWSNTAGSKGKARRYRKKVMEGQEAQIEQNERARRAEEARKYTEETYNTDADDSKKSKKEEEISNEINEKAKKPKRRENKEPEQKKLKERKTKDKAPKE